MKVVKACPFKDLGDLLPKDARVVAPSTRSGGSSSKKGELISFFIFIYYFPNTLPFLAASKRVVASRYSNRSPPSSKLARTGDAPQLMPPPQLEAPSVATPHASVPGSPSIPPSALPRTETSIRGPNFSISMTGRPHVIKERLGRFVFAPEVHHLSNLGTERVVDTYLEGLAQVRVNISFSPIFPYTCSTFLHLSSFSGFNLIHLLAFKGFQTRRVEAGSRCYIKGAYCCSEDDCRV